MLLFAKGIGERLHSILSRICFMIWDHHWQQSQDHKVCTINVIDCCTEMYFCRTLILILQISYHVGRLKGKKGAHGVRYQGYEGVISKGREEYRKDAEK